jgi:hypothetical protein
MQLCFYDCQPESMGQSVLWSDRRLDGNGSSGGSKEFVYVHFQKRHLTEDEELTMGVVLLLGVA